MDGMYKHLTHYLCAHFGLEESALSPDKTFSALEMDSISLVELVVIMEDELGLKLPEDASILSGDSTLTQAADVLAQAYTTPAQAPVTP